MNRRMSAVQGCSLSTLLGESNLTLNDLVQCPLCQEKMKDPKLLPCSDSYCEGCLEKYVGKRLHQEVECPLCRIMFDVGHGVQELPNDVEALQLIDLIDKLQQESVNVSSPSKVEVPTFHICGMCEEEEHVVATVYCEDCGLYLCAEDEKVHKRRKITKEHRLIGVSERREHHEKKKATAKVERRCKKHNEKIKLFCRTCEKLICSECALTTHKEPGHDYVYISDAVKEGPSFEDLLKMLQMEMDVIDEAARSVDDMTHKVKARVERIMDDADGHVFELIIKLVKQYRQALKKELDKNIEELHQQKQELEAQKLKVLQVFIEAEGVLKSGDEIDILTTKASLRDHHKVKARKLFPVRRDNIHVECNKYTLGTGKWNTADEAQVTEGVWEAMNTMMGQNIDFHPIKARDHEMEERKKREEKEEQKRKKRREEEELHRRKQKDEEEIVKGYKDTLKQWSGNTEKNMVLLYKASIHGYSAAEFHERCDYKGETWVVAESKDGHIFGSYTSVGWASRGGYVRDEKAYVFTLKNTSGIAPTKYVVNKERKQYSIYDHPNYGPTSGENDIEIRGNMMSGKSHFPVIYVDSTGRGSSTFAGSKNFVLKDVEVWGVGLERCNVEAGEVWLKMA